MFLFLLLSFTYNAVRRRRWMLMSCSRVCFAMQCDWINLSWIEVRGRRVKSFWDKLCECIWRCSSRKVLLRSSLTIHPSNFLSQDVFISIINFLSDGFLGENIFFLNEICFRLLFPHWKLNFKKWTQKKKVKLEKPFLSSQTHESALADVAFIYSVEGAAKWKLFTPFIKVLLLHRRAEMNSVPREACVPTHEAKIYVSSIRGEST